VTGNFPINFYDGPLQWNVISNCGMKSALQSRRFAHITEPWPRSCTPAVPNLYKLGGHRAVLFSVSATDFVASGALSASSFILCRVRMIRTRLYRSLRKANRPQAADAAALIVTWGSRVQPLVSKILDSKIFQPL
jgi:hypothetical protein